jgi:DNA adenine methylase
MVKKLIPLVPEHRIYVEVFGGGASLLLAKEPALVEVYNDLDAGLVNLFRVLRDPALFAEFRRRVQLTPYSRGEFYRYRELWRAGQAPADPVENAASFFVLARQNFGGMFGKSWGVAVSTSSRGMASEVSKWLSAIDHLPEVAERFLRVQVECLDWRRLLPIYDTAETFFYLDPPYLAATRKDGQYAHELADSDHEALVGALLALKGKALLSGYANPLYAKLEAAGWRRRDYATSCFAAGRTRASGLRGSSSVTDKAARTETIWANYDLPPADNTVSPGKLAEVCHGPKETGPGSAGLFAGL